MATLETPIEDEVVEEYDGDVIVIPKSLLITALATLLAFALGGTGGYFLARTTFQAGAQAAAEQVIQAPPPAQAQAPAQPTAPPARIDNVSVDDDPALGPEDAPITIVEFSDFRCPFCGRFRAETFDPLMEQYEGQIRFVYRDFPVVGGVQAAQAAQCANDQDAFWEYHDLLFADQQGYNTVDDFVGAAEELELDSDTFRECLESGKYEDEVNADAADARQYGVSGTPTFFINGVRVIGAQPLAAFTSVIDEELGQ